MQSRISIVRLFALTLALSLLSAPLARAADEEMVENPMYASWAKHKPGTAVTAEPIDSTALSSASSASIAE